MGLVESLEVVRRCARADRTVRLRKSRIKMADVVANVALVSAMIQPVTEEQPLYDLIEEWFNLYPDTQVLFQLLRDMIFTAVSSQHIYILGRLLVKKVILMCSTKSVTGRCNCMYLKGGLDS